jgi:hypothetical protein
LHSPPSMPQRSASRDALFVNDAQLASRICQQTALTGGPTLPICGTALSHPPDEDRRSVTRRKSTAGSLEALRCRTRQSIALATLTHTLELASERPSPEALRCPSGQGGVTKKRRSSTKRGQIGARYRPGIIILSKECRTWFNLRVVPNSAASAGCCSFSPISASSCSAACGSVNSIPAAATPGRERDIVEPRSSPSRRLQDKILLLEGQNSHNKLFPAINKTFPRCHLFFVFCPAKAALLHCPGLSQDANSCPARILPLPARHPPTHPRAGQDGEHAAPRSAHNGRLIACRGRRASVRHGRDGPVRSHWCTGSSCRGSCRAGACRRPGGRWHLASAARCGRAQASGRPAAPGGG